MLDLVGAGVTLHPKQKQKVRNSAPFGLEVVLQGLLAAVFGTGAAFVTAIGQFLLGGVLAGLAVLMFLRFKRGRVNSK